MLFEEWMNPGFPSISKHRLLISVFLKFLPSRIALCSHITTARVGTKRRGNFGE